MDTLQITKDAAIKAHQNAKASGKEMLENLFGKKVFLKKVTERIKTFDDVLAELGIDAKVYEANNTGLSDDEIAYRQIKYIAKVLNEGWTPDWNNSAQYKYRPWFKFNDPSSVGGFSYYVCDGVSSSSPVGSLLCFKSSELAEYAGTQFLDIYRRFMTF